MCTAGFASCKSLRTLEVSSAVAATAKKRAASSRFHQRPDEAFDRTILAHQWPRSAAASCRQRSPGTRADQLTRASTASGIGRRADRKSTRLNSSHPSISYAVFCLKKKKIKEQN